MWKMLVVTRDSHTFVSKFETKEEAIEWAVTLSTARKLTNFPTEWLGKPGESWIRAVDITLITVDEVSNDNR